MLILEGNPVCANNSKDTTKNVQMYKTKPLPASSLA